MSSDVQSLTDQALAAFTTGGRAIFVLGPPGAGKADLINRIKQAAGARGAQIVEAACDTDPQGNRLWAGVARDLTRRARLTDAGKRVTRAWLSVIPILGPFISAIVETVVALRSRGKTSAAEPGTAARRVMKIIANTPLEPRCIILNRFEAASGQHLAGAAALIRELAPTRTLVVFSVRTSLSGRAPQAVEDLLLETERLRVGSCFRLRSDHTVQPDARAEVSEHFHGLNDADRELLSVAASAGATFESAVIAELTGRDELDLEDRFARLCRAEILRAEPLPEALQAVTSRYTFVNPHDAVALMQHISPEERARINERVLVIRSQLGISAY